MTIWRMPIACWIPKAKNVHSEYVILIALHYNNSCMSVTKCHVTRTQPVFFELWPVNLHEICLDDHSTKTKLLIYNTIKFKFCVQKNTTFLFFRIKKKVILII